MWKVYHPPSSVGRGVVGVLEVRSIEPSHDKQVRRGLEERHATKSESPSPPSHLHSHHPTRARLDVGRAAGL
eukprot:3958985-Prymnesium_polylepis.2